MDSEGVSLPWLHKHPMVPWQDLRRGDCCRWFESSSDGYYCKRCDLFVHKKCGDEAPRSIQHPSQPAHTLQLIHEDYEDDCSVCGFGKELLYRCDICYFNIDLHCVKYPPPKFIDISEVHHHKLTLVKSISEVQESDNCGKCRKIIMCAFPYICQECKLAFHVHCVWYPSKEVKHPLEVNHCYHSLHPLKLLTGRPPEYSDGKCRLCGKKVDMYFYHCSSCNFTLDMCCVLSPPPQSVLNLKAHDHQLTLLPRHRSFICNACGLSGDRSPYICVQCDFIIHQECLDLPRVININRHDHRVSRIPLIGVVNSVCGVCRKKVDWTCGGYSCQRCSGYVVHSKCATRKDVWNGKELEGVPEEIEDIEPYVRIDENTIQHFSHIEHHLRLDVDALLCEENKRCNACSHPICLQSFYGCMDCDFILHKDCAELPKRKWHVLHNERLTLVTSKADLFYCRACFRYSNGFRYQHGEFEIDVQCGSIDEPFVHPSHPHHPLYHTLQTYEEENHKEEFCNCCKWRLHYHKLRCIEDDCGFNLCFKCATLPQVVQHRTYDRPLSLCFGEKASGKYWCDICEKETNPEKWFYTCKDHQASLHIDCVLGKGFGEFLGLMPTRRIKFPPNDKLFEVVLNSSVTRPICTWCKSRCLYPIILKKLGTSKMTYLCSHHCVHVERPRPNPSTE